MISKARLGEHAAQAMAGCGTHCQSQEPRLDYILRAWLSQLVASCSQSVERRYRANSPAFVTKQAKPNNAFRSCVVYIIKVLSIEYSHHHHAWRPTTSQKYLFSAPHLILCPTDTHIHISPLSPLMGSYPGSSSHEQAPLPSLSHFSHPSKSIDSATRSHDRDYHHREYQLQCQHETTDQQILHPSFLHDTSYTLRPHHGRAICHLLQHLHLPSHKYRSTNYQEIRTRIFICWQRYGSVNHSSRINNQRLSHS